MAVFTDTVTIYQKQANETWTRTVLSGVQWSEKSEKTNENGQISVAKYISLTIPYPQCESVTLEPFTDEDAIVYGNVSDTVTTEKGHRIADLLKSHNGGIIQSVNDNMNRSFLQNIKVVVA